MCCVWVSRVSRISFNFLNLSFFLARQFCTCFLFWIRWICAFECWFLSIVFILIAIWLSSIAPALDNPSAFRRRLSRRTLFRIARRCFAKFTRGVALIALLGSIPLSWTIARSFKIGKVVFCASLEAAAFSYDWGLWVRRKEWSCGWQFPREIWREVGVEIPILDLLRASSSEPETASSALVEFRRIFSLARPWKCWFWSTRFPRVRGSFTKGLLGKLEFLVLAE